MINREIYHNGQKIREDYTKWSDPATNGGAFDEFNLAGSTPRYSYDMKIVDDAVYSREYISPTQPGLWTRNGIAVAQTDQAAITAAPPGKVPPGKYLMLGDHRNNSNDGHVWGFVPRENIIGKAVCVFWPPTRLGLVDRMTKNQRKP